MKTETNTKTIEFSKTKTKAETKKNLKT